MPDRGWVATIRSCCINRLAVVAHFLCAVGTAPCATAERLFRSARPVGRRSRCGRSIAAREGGQSQGVGDDCGAGRRKGLVQRDRGVGSGEVVGCGTNPAAINSDRSWVRPHHSRRCMLPRRVRRESGRTISSIAAKAGPISAPVTVAAACSKSARVASADPPR